MVLHKNFKHFKLLYLEPILGLDTYFYKLVTMAFGSLVLAAWRKRYVE